MSNQDYLNVLNQAQHAAVTATPSNLLVLAGAGSGKTRVLVNRIAWLLQSSQITPANVVAVTFTNKAAREMRTRLEDILRIPLHGMWVGTFHSLAHRLLRSHWQEAGLQQNFQIIDADDQLRIIKRVHKNLSLDQEKWPPKQSQWFINEKKEEGIRPWHLQNIDDYFNDTLRKIYMAYEEICQSSSLVDFAELLLRSHELWLKNPELLQHYQGRFKHILVDEFQDTNRIQYAWIRLLASNDSYLTIVGDDDQSIYGWRGAKVENIYKLEKDFSDIRTIRLEQNYRSTGNILMAANAVIANNAERLGKNLWTEDDEGESITLYSAFNEVDEARFVIESIRGRLGKGYSCRDMAVLYRSNAQSRVLEEQLLQAGIKYKIYGGFKFFERAEVKDTLAYVRLIINHEDDSALERVINLPTRGIGNATLTIIREYSKKNNCSLWRSLHAVISEKQLSSRASSACAGFLRLIGDMAENIKELPLYRQIECVIQNSGLRAHVAKEKTERGRAKLENLQELVNAAQQFGEEEGGDLTAFLTYSALELGGSQEDIDDDNVQLMTLHSAKGLEFKIVFICGIEAGLFPHQLSVNEPGGLEEERRLCYVGITRAMEKLYLSYAQSRRVHGHEIYRRPSRFLNEIPINLIEGLDSLSRLSRPVNLSAGSTITPTKIVAASSNHQIGNTKLRVGQHVKHKKFGEGVILDYEGSGDYTRIQVRFVTAGVKWLVASYAKLEVL